MMFPFNFGFIPATLADDGDRLPRFDAISKDIEVDVAITGAGLTGIRCPCHGSRFRPDGAVFSGPAESSLGEK